MWAGQEHCPPQSCQALLPPASDGGTNPLLYLCTKRKAKSPTKGLSASASYSRRPRAQRAVRGGGQGEEVSRLLGREEHWRASSLRGREGPVLPSEGLREGPGLAGIASEAGEEMLWTPHARAENKQSQSSDC